jgi:hypothetical protein
VGCDFGDPTRVWAEDRTSFVLASKRLGQSTLRTSRKGDSNSTHSIYFSTFSITNYFLDSESSRIPKILKISSSKLGRGETISLKILSFKTL